MKKKYHQISSSSPVFYYVAYALAIKISFQHNISSSFLGRMDPKYSGSSDCFNIKLSVPTENECALKCWWGTSGDKKG